MIKKKTRLSKHYKHLIEKTVETETTCMYIYMTDHCPGLVKSLL